MNNRIADPFDTGIEVEAPAPQRRLFVQYAPEIPIEIDGTVIGLFVVSQLSSTRVPGYGPEIPPNIVEVTGRTQEGLNLDGDGWTAFCYEPETDTFKEYDRDKAFPVTNEKNPGCGNCISLRDLARRVWDLGAFYLKGRLKWK